ncbi:hypothetical protein GDO86_002030 [Hymenochirus boettgeri]|uniref:Uncharacterized protein n=1 Tax=Hymenochirus boettgeri TaxID=247094 RepID=A0A8T2KF74_9PIPI|nr:hypothetical protein GDO86_002030 [Hymenochirus boettgeri]
MSLVKQMSSGPRTLQFEEWIIGRRKLRYLYICSDCSFTLHHGHHHQEDNIIPVFLGADVVAETGIRTENHPKLHAKFSKKGLSARLNFSSDFRFEKLRLPGGLNTLWFYSIQGVFRVAFDLYTREDQLSVIESLQDLWKSRVKDGPLKKYYNMEDCFLNSDMTKYVTQSNPHVAKQHSFKESSHYSHTSQRVQCSFPVSSNIKEHNYCLSGCGRPSVSLSQKAMDSELIFQRLHALLCMYPKIDVELNDQLKTVILMSLEVIEQAASEKNVDKITLSILQLLDKTSNFSKNSTQKEIPSVYDNQLLYEVSSWLGKRFQIENECISSQVEEFKRKHIDRISDLPPAQELVSALFPKAMKVLFLNWMGLTDETKLQSEYPILLLILEFVNRNLITGVAHVLYSTLICK